MHKSASAVFGESTDDSIEGRSGRGLFGKKSFFRSASAYSESKRRLSYGVHIEPAEVEERRRRSQENRGTLSRSLGAADMAAIRNGAKALNKNPSKISWDDGKRGSSEQPWTVLDISSESESESDANPPTDSPSDVLVSFPNPDGDSVIHAHTSDLITASAREELLDFDDETPTLNHGASSLQLEEATVPMEQTSFLTSNLMSQTSHMVEEKIS